MELIKPQSIAPEIMNLMEEAKELVIIVSPYNKVASWRKLHKSLEKMKRNNIAVEYYIRKDNKESYDEVKAIGFIPIPVPNLHTKLYMNEKQGIVTSMNLHESSDDNSLDIGYRTQTQVEYQELFAYFEDNIRCYNNNQLAIKEINPSYTYKRDNYQKQNEVRLNFFTHLEYELKKKLLEYPVKRQYENVYIIGSRTVEVTIQSGKHHQHGYHQYVNVYSILPGVLFDFFAPLEYQLQKETQSNIAFKAPGKGTYSYFNYSLRAPDKSPLQFTNEEIRALVDELVRVQILLWQKARQMGDRTVNDNIHYQR